MLVTLRWQRIKLVNTENIELVALFLQLKTYKFLLQSVSLPSLIQQLPVELIDLFFKSISG